MKIIVGGDFCPRYGLKQIIEKGDIHHLFDDVKRVISGSDYSLVNLEGPVIEGHETPIVKTGPSLSLSSKSLDAIKYAGFSCVTLANNHFNDYGKDGCLNTFRRLKEKGFDYVGAGVNIKDASTILFKRINGNLVAFINVCEKEFSIATDSEPGSNPLDAVSLYYQILNARKNADWVLLIIHGGNEHYDYPSPRMKKTYKWFIDLGVDAVINHHQHCYSGFEIYNNRPIVYGIGNFCFDRRGNKHSKWDEGYLAELDLDNGNVKLNCIPYVQCRDDYSVRFLSDEQYAVFENRLTTMNSVIADDELLEKRYNSFMDLEMRNKKVCLAPYNHRFFQYACRKGLIPSFISKKRKLFVLDHVRCESLRDVFLYYLEH